VLCRAANMGGATQAWALVVMKRVKPSLFSRMKAAAALKKEYSPSMLSQLFQVDLSLRYEAPALQPVSELNAKDGENADVDEYLELLWLAGNLRGKAARHWTRSKYNNTRIVSGAYAAPPLAPSLSRCACAHRPAPQRVSLPPLRSRRVS